MKSFALIKVHLENIIKIFREELSIDAIKYSLETASKMFQISLIKMTSVFHNK